MANIAIHERFDGNIVDWVEKASDEQYRMTKINLMILDKDATTSNDVLDAMKLACKRILISRQENQRFDFKAAV